MKEYKTVFVDRETNHFSFMRISGGKYNTATGLTKGTAFDIPVDDTTTDQEVMLEASKRFAKYGHLPVGVVLR